MSAWCVSKGHIDALVMGGIVYSLVDPSEATDFGRMLWEENYRSVNHRYAHRDDHPCQTPPYTFKGIEVPLDVVGLWKQVACYDYQTCEHDEYQESRAHAFVEAMMEALTRDLGMEPSNHPSWGKAPWGIESPLEIAAARS